MVIKDILTDPDVPAGIAIEQKLAPPLAGKKHGRHYGKEEKIGK